MEIKSIKFIIPGEFPLLTEIINISKQHHMKYSNMKKNFTNHVSSHVLAQLESPDIFIAKADVHLHWVRKSKRGDPDNIRAASKFILDGLVKARVLDDDSQKNIMGISDSWSSDNEYPRVEVTLRWFEK